MSLEPWSLAWPQWWLWEGQQQVVGALIEGGSTGPGQGGARLLGSLPTFPACGIASHTSLSVMKLCVSVENSDNRHKERKTSHLGGQITSVAVLGW